MNRNFWKFVGGFLGIVALAVGMLWGFQYWRNYKEEQEIKTLLREIQKERDIFPNSLEKDFQTR
jgi:predicted negative regulator of RcsB-dependent stress response